MRERAIEYTPRWRTLEKGDHSSFMQFYCTKCDSDDIEISGTSIKWYYKRQRWHISNPDDAMYECMDCQEKAPLSETVRKQNVTDRYLSQVYRI